MNDINYLIISNSVDYSTDLVCYRLQKQKKHYLRINRDEFNNYNITYDLSNEQMIIYIANKKYIIRNSSLSGIYFRAPVFLRDYNKKYLSLNEQLYRSQWSSFIRNLIIFDKAVWINNPVATYRAENKLFQLKSAKKIGFMVPKTILTNNEKISINSKKLYIVKSLDSALFYNNLTKKEMFTYSNILIGNELKQYDLSNAPLLIQEFISPKIDIRATFIGGKIFPVKILHNGNGLHDDWRKQKNNLEYIPFTLPLYIQNKIKKLMSYLNLNFGGIDLILNKNNYYFIEVNPTGEWGWLETTSKLPISEAIVKYL